MDSSGSGTIANAIRCIDHCMCACALHTEYSNQRNHHSSVGALLTSNSWGTNFTSQALESAIAGLADAGGLFVCSAGNNGWNIDVPGFGFWPAKSTHRAVISVASSDRRDQLSPFSNFGRCVQGTSPYHAEGTRVHTVWAISYADTLLSCCAPSHTPWLSLPAGVQDIG